MTVASAVVRSDAFVNSNAVIFVAYACDAVVFITDVGCLTDSSFGIICTSFPALYHKETTDKDTEDNH